MATYTVKSGDTLNKIAASLGYSSYTKVPGLTGYGSNPNLIKPGQVLTYGEATPVVQPKVDVSKPITSDNLTGNTLVVPNNPQTNPYAGIGSATKLPEPPAPQPVEPESEYTKAMKELVPVNPADIQAKLDQQYAIEQKTQTANALKAQIDTNTAEAKAAQQTLESQAGGKDVTSTFLGRQQQEIDRQLAIRNLPLTAEYQASLGDLQGAQATVNKLYTANLAYAENLYNQKKDNIEAAYNVATAKEKKLLDAKKIEEERKYETEKNRIAFENEKALLKYKQQLEGVKPTTEVIKMDDGSQKLIDSNTGKIVASYGAGTTPTKDNAQLALVNDINNILSDPAIDSVFGIMNSINRNIPGSSAYTVTANVNNVIQQAALAARGQLKGQGTVSDFEGKMLKEAQTALKLNMNVEDAKKALAKLRGAVVTSSGGSAQVMIIDKNGNAKLGLANQSMINQAISSGYRVEYQ